MGLCKVAYKITSWFEAIPGGCPGRDMWSIAERTFCLQLSQSECDAQISSLNRTTLTRCRFVQADFVSEISEVTSSRWAPCGICSNAPPGPCNFGSSFCNRYIFRTDGTPDCGEANYDFCVDGLVLEANNPSGCCPHSGASYAGCYVSESAGCCAQAGDSALAQKCSFYQNDPCIRGCCCPTGCQDVSSSDSCPQGCFGKSDNTPCVGVNDPACGQSCCLCNQCCDIDALTCAARGGATMSGSCSQPATQTSCRNANVKPSCKKATFQIGPRAASHTTAFLPIRPHVLEVVSTGKHRLKDLPMGTEECRQQYGWMQPSTAKNEIEGRICNTWNRNCVGTGQKGKTSPALKLVKSTQGNFMEFQARYRPPCPEQTGAGCYNVGCAA